MKKTIILLLFMSSLSVVAQETGLKVGFEVRNDGSASYVLDGYHNVNSNVFVNLYVRKNTASNVGLSYNDYTVSESFINYKHNSRLVVSLGVQNLKTPYYKSNNNITFKMLYTIL